MLGLSHSATVRLVDKLERSELAERRSADDARAVAVAPTAEGIAIAERIQRARLDALSELLDPLTSAERKELARLHEKLLAGLVATGELRGRICRLCDAGACGHDAANVRSPRRRVRRALRRKGEVARSPRRGYICSIHIFPPPFLGVAAGPTRGVGSERKGNRRRRNQS